MDDHLYHFLSSVPLSSIYEMRLLKTDTHNGLTLQHFHDPDSRPRYAILSHTWGDDELLYDDVINKKYQTNWKGYRKVIGCCALARQQQLRYVWIDTCCIDKSSSAELQEAINSMFQWYQEAAVCFAYLRDVKDLGNPRKEKSSFRSSRWFTRGWTLQELIAPTMVIFLTNDWKVIGDKSNLAETLEEITGIEYGVLCGLTSIQEASIAKKMSWAAQRETTRPEDRAYSLMGLFGVNMPTIYGEGTRAFYRLQQEIMARNADHSIFAWGIFGISSTLQGMLASSPDDFVDSANVFDTPYQLFRKTWQIASPVPDIQKTSSGLCIEVPVINDPNPGTQGDEWIYVGLACKNLVSDPPSRRLGTVGILLMRARGSEDIYVRPSLNGVLDFDRMASVCGEWTVKRVHVADQYQWGGDVWGSVPSQRLHPPLLRITIMAHTLGMLRNKLNCSLAPDLSFLDARFPEPRNPRPLQIERQNAAHKSGEAFVDYDVLIEAPRRSIAVLVFVPSSDSPENTFSTSAFAIGILLFSPSSLAIQILPDVDLTQTHLSTWHEHALGKYQLQDWGSEGVFWLSGSLAPGLTLELDLTRIRISPQACHGLLDIKIKRTQFSFHLQFFTAQSTVHLQPEGPDYDTEGLSDNSLSPPVILQDISPIPELKWVCVSLSRDNLLPEPLHSGSQCRRIGTSRCYSGHQSNILQRQTPKRILYCSFPK